MKYWCANCERDFDEEEIVPVYQWDGEGVMGGYHVVEGKCPYCGSIDDMEEAEECSCCGELYGKESALIRVDDFWYCHDCAEAIHDEFEKTWKKIKAKGASNG